MGASNGTWYNTSLTTTSPNALFVTGAWVGQTWSRASFYFVCVCAHEVQLSSAPLFPCWCVPPPPPFQNTRKSVTVAWSVLSSLGWRFQLVAVDTSEGKGEGECAEELLRLVYACVCARVWQHCRHSG